MSASMQQRSCSDLGACLARSDCHECGYPIGECQDTGGDGAMCTRVHRAPIVDPENPPMFEAPRRTNHYYSLWLLGPTLVIAVVLLMVHLVAWWRP